MNNLYYNECMATNYKQIKCGLKTSQRSYNDKLLWKSLFVTRDNKNPNISSVPLSILQ